MRLISSVFQEYCYFRSIVPYGMGDAFLCCLLFVLSHSCLQATSSKQIENLVSFMVFFFLPSCHVQHKGREKAKGHVGENTCLAG